MIGRSGRGGIDGLKVDGVLWVTVGGGGCMVDGRVRQGKREREEWWRWTGLGELTGRVDWERRREERYSQ